MYVRQTAQRNTLNEPKLKILTVATFKLANAFSESRSLGFVNMKTLFEGQFSYDNYFILKKNVCFIKDRFFLQAQNTYLYYLNRQ